MGEEVQQSSSQLTDVDPHAVAAHLKDQPGNDQEPPTSVAGFESALRLGSHVYADKCLACHGPDGKGY
jgi:cytochrome c553